MMTRKTNILAIIFILTAFFILPQPALAQSNLPSCADAINPIRWPHCTFSIIGNLLVTGIEALIIVGALFAFWNIIQGAFQYMSAQSTEAMGKARSNISWSIGGIFGLAAAFGLFRFVISYIPNIDSYIWT